MSHIIGPYTYLLGALTLSSYTDSFFFALVLGLIADFVTAATTAGFWVVGYIDYALMIPIMIILGALAGLVLIRSFGFVPPIYRVHLPSSIPDEPQDIPFIRGVLGMFLILVAYVPIELGRHTSLFSEWMGYLISLGASYVLLFMAYWLTKHDPVLFADGNSRKLHRHLAWINTLVLGVAVLNMTVFPTAWTYLAPIIVGSAVVAIVHGARRLGLIQAPRQQRQHYQMPDERNSLIQPSPPPPSTQPSVPNQVIVWPQ